MKHAVSALKRMPHTCIDANVIPRACVECEWAAVYAIQKADTAEIVTRCVSHVYAGCASDESDNAQPQRQFIQAVNMELNAMR